MIHQMKMFRAPQNVWLISDQRPGVPARKLGPAVWQCGVSKGLWEREVIFNKTINVGRTSPLTAKGKEHIQYLSFADNLTEGPPSVDLVEKYRPVASNAAVESVEVVSSDAVTAQVRYRIKV